MLHVNGNSATVTWFQVHVNYIIFTTVFWLISTSRSKDVLFDDLYPPFIWSLLVVSCDFSKSIARVFVAVSFLKDWQMLLIDTCICLINKLALAITVISAKCLECFLHALSPNINLCLGLFGDNPYHILIHLFTLSKVFQKKSSDGTNSAENGVTSKGFK